MQSLMEYLEDLPKYIESKIEGYDIELGSLKEESNSTFNLRVYFKKK